MFFKQIKQHQIFLHASSFAYYAALGLAPLLFIILSLTSFFGEIAQESLIHQLQFINPEISQVLIDILKQNKIQQLGQAGTGISSFLFFIFLSSLIFNQLRNTFDVIMENHPIAPLYSFGDLLKKRGIVIMVALMMCLLFTLSLFIGPLLKLLILSLNYPIDLNPAVEVIFHITFLTTLFTGLFLLTPSQSRGIRSSLKMGFVSSIGFLVGNYLTGLYMRQFAFNSLYGAAGAILIFLLWAFYSALTIFLVMEGFMYFEKMRGDSSHFLR